MKWINKFCYNHPNFGLQNLMIYVIGSQAFVLLLGMFGIPIYSYLGFSLPLILQGQIWRLVTFLFIPSSSNLLNFVLISYFYYFVGSTLERYWGTVKFNVYYLIGILLTLFTGIIGALFNAHQILSTSYINQSMFFAIATLIPDTQVLLFFIIPIKMKWLAIFEGILLALQVLGALFALDLFGAVLILVPMLNYLLFFHEDLRSILKRNRAYYGHTTSKRTIGFKAAQKEAQKKKGYLHKCTVCGRTDTDFPQLEFRYCSKCNGYFCYCQDHINEHTHQS